MSVGDTLKNHWKKLALVGAVLGIGICVTLGIVLSGDVEKPDDAEITEGGSFGAQHGDGDDNTAPGGDSSSDTGSTNVQVEDPFKNIHNHEQMKPLLTKKNYESNVFAPLKNGESPKIDDTEYIVYLQNQNAGGQMIKACFEEYFKNEDSRNKPTPVSPAQTPKLFEDAKRDKTLPNRFLMGEKLLGICDMLPETTKCSYFTILTDPYERITSTYVQALSSGAIDATDSIKDWGLSNRDYFLHQILETAESGTSPHSNEAAELEEAIVAHPDDALDVALIGIRTWFKFVCTSGDMVGCFEQIKIAYGLNTDECFNNIASLKPAGKPMDPGVAGMIAEQLKGHEGLPGKTPLEQLKNMLLADEEMSESLHSDRALFEEADATAHDGKAVSEKLLRP